METSHENRGWPTRIVKDKRKSGEGNKGEEAVNMIKVHCVQVWNGHKETSY
jgi:hypothetical protein